MKNIYGETLESLQEMLKVHQYKIFAARQIFEWIYKKETTDFELMSNLSKSLRTFLASTFRFETLLLKTKQSSSDQTKKYLFELFDGHLIETVLMQHDYGISVCITTQVGCNIGCSFCASGLTKRIRNLKTSEMVLQLVEVARLEKIRVSHVVIMGTGEPFDNYDNVMKFIDIINNPYGLEIGARHITVSTSGIVPKIIEFKESKKQVNLAISLHAANNELRSKLMKINNVYPLEVLIDSIKQYIDKTNRRVTFEYILLEGINDSIIDANQLSDLLRGINCYVNLIRYNKVKELNYRPSIESRAVAFHHQLMLRGINATLRREKGADIDAACGQLRASTLKTKSGE